MTPFDCRQVFIVILLGLFHIPFIVGDSSVLHVVVNIGPGILIMFDHMLTCALLHLASVLDRDYLLVENTLSRRIGVLIPILRLYRLVHILNMHIMRWAKSSCQVHWIQRSGVTCVMVMVIPVFRTVFHLIYYRGPSSCLMS